MANKQTAVDWLMEQYDKSFGPSFSLIMNDEIKRAKLMEKEQMKYASCPYIGGWEDDEFEQYYDYTYGGNNGK